MAIGSISSKLRLLLLSALLLSFFSSRAQYMDPRDQQFFNLGFRFGVGWASYNLKEQINVFENGVLLKNIDVSGMPSLNLGMIANFNLQEHISLRVVPHISLEQRNFNFNFAWKDPLEQDFNDSTVIRKISGSYLNIPVMAQWKSKFTGKSRFYVLTGFQLGFNLASDKKVQDDENLLKIRTEDLSVVLGVGITLYGDWVKLSPEITYSVGLIDLFIPENTTHSDAISRLSSQVISINFNFE